MGHTFSQLSEARSGDSLPFTFTVRHNKQNTRARLGLTIIDGRLLILKELHPSNDHRPCVVKSVSSCRLNNRESPDYLWVIMLDVAEAIFDT